MHNVEIGNRGPLRFEADAGMMASDGFHPGAPIYAEWAERAVHSVLSSGRLARTVKTPIADPAGAG